MKKELLEIIKFNDILVNNHVLKFNLVNDSFFKSSGQLYKSEETTKILKKSISNIYFLSSLIEFKSTGIKPFSDDFIIYPCILFIFIEFKSKQNVKKEIVDIIDSLIEVPLFIFCYNKESSKFKIYFSQKRKSKNQINKSVTENSYLTQDINLYDTDLSALNINNATKMDLYSFYTSYANKILNFDAIKFDNLQFNKINFNSISILNRFKNLYYEKQNLKKIKPKNIKERTSISERIFEISEELNKIKKELK